MNYIYTNLLINLVSLTTFIQNVPSNLAFLVFLLVVASWRANLYIKNSSFQNFICVFAYSLKNDNFIGGESIYDWVVFSKWTEDSNGLGWIPGRNSQQRRWLYPFLQLITTMEMELSWNLPLILRRDLALVPYRVIFVQ